MNTINDPSGIGFRTPFFASQAPSSSTTPGGGVLLCDLCRNLGNWFVENWTSLKEGEKEEGEDAETEIPRSRSRSSHCRYTTYQHHLSWNALYESASAPQGGCSFCYQLALEGEERFMGGTIAYKIREGKSTAFTAEIQHTDGEDVKTLFFCDRVKWSVFDIKVLPSIVHTFLSVPAVRF